MRKNSTISDSKLKVRINDKLIQDYEAGYANDSEGAMFLKKGSEIFEINYVASKIWLLLNKYKNQKNDLKNEDIVDYLSNIVEGVSEQVLSSDIEFIISKFNELEIHPFNNENIQINNFNTPNSIAWNYTYKCNLNCKHCYSRKLIYTEMEKDFKIKIAEAIGQSNIFSVDFGGGEPFMDNSLFETAAILKNYGVDISLTTNGTLVNDSTISEIKRIKFSAIGVSIDSDQEDIQNAIRGENVFKKAVKTIRKLVKEDIFTEAITTISKLNANRLENIHKFCKELGVSVWRVQLFRPMGLGYQNINKFMLSADEVKKAFTVLYNLFQDNSIKIDLGIGSEPLWHLFFSDLKLENKIQSTYLKGGPCGKISCCIRPNGDVSPCAYVPMSIGNMLKSSLELIWNEMRNWVVHNDILSGKCLSCPVNKSCLGGCKANRILLNEKYDIYCWKNE